MRPSDWAPVGFDHDPVPGDPTVVSSAATDYSTIATTLENAATNLRGIAGADECVSEAVAAIMEQAEEVAARLDKAQTRYEGVAAALSIYAVPLSEAQTWSVDALDAAVVARSATNASVEDAEFYEARLREPDLSPELESYYERRRTEVYAELQLHDGALEDAIARLQNAIEHRDSAASAASSSIHDVEESSGLNDSFRDNTVQFIEENKDTIDLIVNIIGWVATIAMIVAIAIPGLNVIVGTFLLIAAGVQALNAALQGLAGTMSPAESIMNIAFAALTFVGAGVVGKLAAKTMTSTQATVGTAYRTSYAGSGIKGMTQSRALDYVDSIANVSHVKGLTWGMRLLNAGGDFREVVKIQSMANIQLLSGANATGAASGLFHLSKVSGVFTLIGTAGQVFGIPQRLGNAIGDVS
ncbi:DUF2104 family protein [Salinibacterium sp. SWN1162]|uniref:DUF2104 family protein n=1 Tax=Salinibacterium sp. SWN1162 TaxID=2792053 RepID=UPI0018CD47EB|nr:DUF2104 family protein [Salinibacterium sp. SWN1162]MBH0008865.1 DUF2104 family protein [Salinibacterium sp. SWN1162]